MPAPSPVFCELPPCFVIQLALILAEGLGIQPARRAYTAIAQEYLVAQISRIGAQLPFMHAGIATKSEPAFGNLAAATAARALFTRHPPARLSALCTHTRSSK